MSGLDPRRTQQRIAAPSDLNAMDGPVTVGGRVLALLADHALLGDAFSLVRVSPPPEPKSRIVVGSLAIVEGAAREGQIEGANWRSASDTAPPEAVDALITDAAQQPTSQAGQGLSRIEGTDAERFITHGVGARLRARARLLSVIRAFFEERGFLEVDTPILVPCPGLDVHLDAFSVDASQGERAELGTETPRPPSANRYLITSPEYQMKRLLVGGIPRCFQLVHCFRRGEVGSRHNPEFMMLELYRAFASVEEVLRDTEDLVRRAVLAFCPSGRAQIEGRVVEVGEPFERLRVAEAFERFAQIPEASALALATEDEERFFRVLVDVVEPALAARPVPVFLHRYPASQASLARRCPDDPRVCERFELYAGGVELCNGFGELTDPVEQRARFAADQAERRRRGLAVYPVDERFVASLDEGMPPSAGNAIGFDRLLALCIGAKSIRDGMPFPEGIL